MGPSGTGGHPPPGPGAGRFPVLLRRGLQQECVGGLRRTGNDRGGLRLLPYGQVLPRAASSSPSSGPARCTTKNSPWSITINVITPSADGRWINRDQLKEENFLEIYLKNELKSRIFLLNYPICIFFVVTHLLQGRMY